MRASGAAATIRGTISPYACALARSSFSRPAGSPRSVAPPAFSLMPAVMITSLALARSEYSPPRRQHHRVIAPCSISFVATLAGEVRFAQIELALDPPPRLVLELADAEQIVHALPLRVDQLKLDLLVNFA